MWKCLPRNHLGLNMRPWQPSLRLPLSPQSPCFLRVCLKPVGTSCDRCLWRRSGVPLQKCCSATHSSRVASETSRTPRPPPCQRGLRGPSASPPLRPTPVPRAPVTPGSRAQRHSTFPPCRQSPVSALPGLKPLPPSLPPQPAQPCSILTGGQVDCSQPSTFCKASQCIPFGGD